MLAHHKSTIKNARSANLGTGHATLLPGKFQPHEFSPIGLS